MTKFRVCWQKIVCLVRNEVWKWDFSKKFWISVNHARFEKLDQISEYFQFVSLKSKIILGRTNRLLMSSHIQLEKIRTFFGIFKTNDRNCSRIFQCRKMDTIDLFDLILKWKREISASRLVFLAETWLNILLPMSQDESDCMTLFDQALLFCTLLSKFSPYPTTYFYPYLFPLLNAWQRDEKNQQEITHFDYIFRTWTSSHTVYRKQISVTLLLLVISPISHHPVILNNLWSHQAMFPGFDLLLRDTLKNLTMNTYYWYWLHVSLSVIWTVVRAVVYFVTIMMFLIYCDVH